MRHHSCNGSGRKYFVFMFSISLVATLGLIGCGGGGGSSSSALPVTPPPNKAPVITSTAPLNAIEEVKYSYNPVASDPGDTLRWSLTNQPSGMTIDPLTGQISWTPAIGVQTSGAVTLTVKDSSSLSDTQIFTVTVFPAGNIVPVPLPGDLSVRISSIDTSNCPNKVSVLLNVLDEEGKLVTDTPSIPDFTVTYNATQIPANEVTAEYKIYNSAVDGTLSVALVLDSSGSLSRDQISTTENAAAGFIRGLNPADSAEVIKFKAGTQVMQPFTTDQNALVAGIFETYDLTLGPGSVFYGSVNKGLADMPIQAGRKAVVAVSDGDATDPGIAGDVINNAIADGIPVYTIGLGSNIKPARLSQLADETGGIFYDLTIDDPNNDEPELMFQAFQSVGEVLDEKWVITFTPPSSPGPGGAPLIVDVTTTTATGSGMKENVIFCP